MIRVESNEMMVCDMNWKCEGKRALPTIMLCQRLSRETEEQDANYHLSLSSLVPCVDCMIKSRYVSVIEDRLRGGGVPF
jgi:hypothetical protein